MNYAILIVFEYSNLHTLPINYLNGSFFDLCYMYEIVSRRLKIPEKNITVITDIKSSGDKPYPWVMKRDGNNVNLFLLEYPCVQRLVSLIKRFIYRKKKIFFYISGHGSKISKNIYSPNENLVNSLVLVKPKDNRLIKVYLTQNQLYQILFGVGDIKIIEEIKTISNSIYYQDTIPNKHNYAIDESAELLFIIDTCNSHNLTDLNYVYSPLEKKMVQANVTFKKLPICVCISASNSTTESHSDGSILTKKLYRYFNNNQEISITDLFNHLKLDQMSITSSLDDPSMLIPFFRG